MPNWKYGHVLPWDKVPLLLSQMVSQSQKMHVFFSRLWEANSAGLNRMRLSSEGLCVRELYLESWSYQMSWNSSSHESYTYVCTPASIIFWFLQERFFKNFAYTCCNEPTRCGFGRKVDETRWFYQPTTMTISYQVLITKQFRSVVSIKLLVHV